MSDRILKAVWSVGFFVVMVPLAVIGYLCHKIIKYTVAGFLVGWIASRDCD